MKGQDGRSRKKEIVRSHLLSKNVREFEKEKEKKQEQEMRERNRSKQKEKMKARKSRVDEKSKERNNCELTFVLQRIWRTKR